MNYLYRVLSIGLFSIAQCGALEFNDERLLELAKQDSNCLASPATIGLLQDHEQKELLAHMAHAAAPGQKRKTIDQTVQEKLEQLHTSRLLMMEPAPQLIHSCKVEKIANMLTKKVHATADGTLLINSWAGAYNISGAEYQPLMEENTMRSGRWIVGGGGTILYRTTGETTYSNTITAWELATKRKLFSKHLPASFWDFYSKRGNWRDGQCATAQEKNAAAQALAQLNEATNYLSLLPIDMRVQSLGSLLSMHNPYFRAFSVDKADRLFAVHNLDGTTKIGDATTGNIVRSLPGAQQYSFEQAGIFDSRNKWFVTMLKQENLDDCCHRPKLLLWNLADESPQPRIIEGNVAAFNADGTLMAASTTQKKELKIWNTDNLACVATFALNFNPHFLQFNPAATRILSKLKGGPCNRKCEGQEVWDVESQNCLHAKIRRGCKLNDDLSLVAVQAKCYQKQAKLKNLLTGQTTYLGGDAEHFALDTAGNYLLINKSVAGPTLYNAKTGCLIKVLKGNEEYYSFGKAKINSFVANNKLITLSDKEACTWQLHPIDWSKVSAPEKMAFLILEHNYRTGRPFSKAAGAHIQALQHVAQQRYPVTKLLSVDDEPAIAEAKGSVSEYYRTTDNGPKHQLCVHDSNGQIVFAEMMLTGHLKGTVSGTIHPARSWEPGGNPIINLSESHARRLYYLLHTLFNEQPKKD